MKPGNDTAISNCARIQLQIRGIVQGVGFRPFVFNLARRHGLTGFVLNGGRGVVVEVEGPEPDVEAFLTALPQQAPPLARIAEISRTKLAPQADTAFVIRPSAPNEPAFALVPADLCVCEACLKDTRDPQNRRFDYPFTNCTNCGPRYSIILDVPYDRDKTTMANFVMCPECMREYRNPTERRFHAQPNACPTCGPNLTLSRPSAPSLPRATTPREILEAAANILRQGGIVSIKGLGGYQLVCDATRQDTVEELRRRKRRNEKPFAVMVSGIASAERLCFISHAERRQLLSAERPIVLLRPRPNALIAAAVSPSSPCIGLMLPYTPLHDLLFAIVQQRWEEDPVFVMTSGNLSEEPIVIDDREAEQRLASVADAFIHHNRAIHTRVDDSVVRVVDEQPMLLRRARGYAPTPVWLGLGDTEVLACGAQQKNTLCLTKSGFALPSQHLGDLENLETLEFFEQTLERMARLFHVTPTVVAHDLHPGYLSTQFAQKLPGVRTIGIQHHHAHIASCMAEHGLTTRVIGVAWDGTGLGSDNTIWGGEFLLADLAGFRRYAHLRPISLVGGDAAIREPWRVAHSYLHDTFEGNPPATAGRRHTTQQPSLRLVDIMLRQNINTIPTSSCGRLFDAIASILDLRHRVSFEGQAAMELEACADMEPESDPAPYNFDTLLTSPVQIDLRPMIRQIVEDFRRGSSRARIAQRFHHTLVAVVTRVCGQMRYDSGIHQVCLSGGCFQNVRLLRRCIATLLADGFEVFTQQQVPANDGGISLGQAAIACELIRRGV